MLAVTDLTSYLYCQRKLYFRKVLGVREPPKVVTVKGSIIHKVFESVHDEVLIREFSEKDSLEDLQLAYRSAFYRTLKSVLRRWDKKIKETEGNALQLFQELWVLFLEEAKSKAEEIYSFAQEHQVYGAALWDALPKAAPEVFIESELLGIRGIIDRIDEGTIPVELKTGKAPREGVRKSHMVQVGAYMLLLSEELENPVSVGYVEYSQIGERRKVMMNPFLKDEILSLIQRVNQLLDEDTLPPKVKEAWKCEHCGVREQCFARP